MPPSSADRLERLALALTNLVDATTDVAIGVAPCPNGGFDLYVHPVDDGEVVDFLTGMVAPPEWTAVAVLARGTARHLDDPRAGHRVTVCHLQARDGVSWSSVSGPDVEAPLHPTVSASGRLAEVCRRVLGLPSGATPGSTLDWWAARWLAELVRRADPPVSWPELAATFPGGGPFGAEADEPAGLVAHGRLVSVCYPWEELRTACGAGLLDVEGVAPPTARWSDAGLFGCWAREALPDTPHLLEEAAHRLAPALARQLRWTVRSWRRSGNR